MTTTKIVVLLSCLGVAIPKPAAAVERVVFCETRTGVCGESRAALGTTTRGFWALKDDGVLLANGSQTGALPTILYFTRAEYEDAIAGLSAKERERAVLRRFAIVSGSVSASLLNLVHDDLIQVAAAVRNLGNDDLSTVLEAATVIAGGPKRFSDTAPPAALHEAREALAKVLADLPRGPAATGYEQEAVALGEIDGAGQKSDGRRIGPVAASQRAYFVPHMSAPRLDPQTLLDQPQYGWHGGVVMMLRPSEAAAAPWQGRGPRLMYVSRSIFMRDIGALTDAQIDRRLRARLAGVPPREQVNFAAGLAFDHAVLLRLYTGPIREKRAPWLSRWNEAIALDGQNLRRALAEAQPKAPEERKARLDQLRANVTLVAAVFRGVSETDPRMAQIATLIARLSQ